MTLTSFVLVGKILSFDSFLVTVEFNTNPEVNGGPSIAVLPVAAIPCEAEVGKKVYVVKNKGNDVPVITCEKEKQ